MENNKAMSEAPVMTQPMPSNVMGDASMQREIAEVQAAIILAKRFPRNVKEAIDRITTACQRHGLAESAIYSYAKGGSEITGPSIRLAEAIAQSWQNLQFGIRELEQRQGESTVEAFAWDIETNVRQVKVFQVKHMRHTKKGSYSLDDPREIYEMTANQGARRLRACILGLIPGDIVELAVDECEKTMKAKADTGPEAVKKMVDAFLAIGVSKEQIEKRIQRRMDSITPAQIVGLRKIFNSLRDGMSSIADWFDVETTDTPKKTGVDAAKEALKKEQREPEDENIPTESEERQPQTPPINEDSDLPTPEEEKEAQEKAGLVPPDPKGSPKDLEKYTTIVNSFTDGKALGEWFRTEKGLAPLKDDKDLLAKVVKLMNDRLVGLTKKK